MIAFMTSLSFVVLAEMGDKTQLLAMAFAGRYSWKTVLWGVFWATLVNHFFAVVAGNFLDHLVPMEYVKITASASLTKLPGPISQSIWGSDHRKK